MDTEQVWRAVEQQRLDLADFLEKLDPPAWEQPSLCAGWWVRDVAAHVTLAARARPLSALVGLIRAGGNFNRYVRMDASARAVRSPEQLIDDLRSVASVRSHPPGTKPIDPLVDILVHGQDIAVPLQLPRTMPVDAAVAAADRVWSMAFPLFPRRRFPTNRLRATNADWTRGEGDEIAGPIETLLLMLTGRQVGDYVS